MFGRRLIMPLQSRTNRINPILICGLILGIFICCSKRQLEQNANLSNILTLNHHFIDQKTSHLAFRQTPLVDSKIFDILLLCKSSLFICATGERDLIAHRGVFTLQLHPYVSEGLP